MGSDSHDLWHSLYLCVSGHWDPHIQYIYNSAAPAAYNIIAHTDDFKDYLTDFYVDLTSWILIYYIILLSRVAFYTGKNAPTKNKFKKKYSRYFGLN